MTAVVPHKIAELLKGAALGGNCVNSITQFILESRPEMTEGPGAFSPYLSGLRRMEINSIV